MELNEVHHEVEAEDTLLCKRALLRTLFDQIDTNGDEQVDCRELANAIQARGNHQIPQHVIDQIFERGDTDADGYITFAEFYDLVQQSDTTPFFQKFFHIPAPNQIKQKASGYWRDCKWMPPPIINLIIIIIQIIIHVIDINSSDRWLKPAMEFSPSHKSEILRYYTYSLVHGSWPHVLGNSIFQLLFGTALEPLHGYRVFVIFVFGVFAGSLAHAVLEHSAALVGSSAGVYALMFSWVSDVFLNWGEQQCPMVSLMPVILLISWDFICAKVSPPSSTSYIAHISGGIGGILSGIIILKNIKEHHFERTTRKVVIGLWIFYFSVLILLNYFDIHSG